MRKAEWDIITSLPDEEVETWTELIKWDSTQEKYLWQSGMCVYMCMYIYMNLYTQIYILCVYFFFLQNEGQGSNFFLYKNIFIYYQKQFNVISKIKAS